MLQCVAMYPKNSNATVHPLFEKGLADNPNTTDQAIVLWWLTIMYTQDGPMVTKTTHWTHSYPFKLAESPHNQDYTKGLRHNWASTKG